ncbi:MAG TPA: M23 family metallopeptidase [Nitrososphaera sp.]|nr:M23 family metallopeptidase [Nitrososphaera sp.]
MLMLSIISALVLLAFIATPWAMSNYYLRYILVALFALAIYFSFRKVKEAQPQAPYSVGDKLADALKVAALFVLLPLDVLALSTYFYPVSPVELSFPLSGGVYCVAQGGNSVLTNPFHKTDANNQIEYALDIVKLNRVGSRAVGIYPQDLTSYAIYGATIYSPCGGEVVKIVDGVPDNLPGDTGHNPSNMIVIRCRGVRVTLAHMTSGSFLVQNGQLVDDGQPLARVGSAGYSIEPHLHIDAIRDFPDVTSTTVEPIPISFNGRILSTNSIAMK